MNNKTNGFTLVYSDAKSGKKNMIGYADEWKTARVNRFIDHKPVSLNDIGSIVKDQNALKGTSPERYINSVLRGIRARTKKSGDKADIMHQLNRHFNLKNMKVFMFKDGKMNESMASFDEFKEFNHCQKMINTV